MKTINVFWCTALLLVWFAPAMQAAELGFGAAGFGNGAGVRISTRAEPLQGPFQARIANGYAVDTRALHRSLVDHLQAAYFGYDIFVEPVEDGKKCRVTISPLGAM